MITHSIYIQPNTDDTVPTQPHTMHNIYREKCTEFNCLLTKCSNFPTYTAIGAEYRNHNSIKINLILLANVTIQLITPKILEG